MGSNTTASQRLANYGLGLLVALVLVTIAWVPVKQAVSWLANRPEVGNAFSDPTYGRTDALVSLGSFVLLFPFVAALIVWVLAIIYALPAGVMLPLGRRIGMPEWMSSVAVISASAAVIYWQSDLWLSPSLHGLGLLARACLTVLK